MMEESWGFEMSSIYFKTIGIKPCCGADLVISFSLIAFRLDNVLIILGQCLKEV